MRELTYTRKRLRVVRCVFACLQVCSFAAGFSAQPDQHVVGHVQVARWRVQLRFACVVLAPLVAARCWLRLSSIQASRVHALTYVCTSARACGKLCVELFARMRGNVLRSPAQPD